MPFRLRYRLLFLAILCLLAGPLFETIAYADEQPPKERSRQRSGDRSSRDAQSGNPRTPETSDTRATASDRQSRTGRQGRSNDASSSVDRSHSAKRSSDESSHLDASISSRGDSERSTAKSTVGLGSEQQANVQQLQADLQVLAQGIQGADDEIRSLAEDLQAMSPQKPDPALVEDLAVHLAAAVADGSLSPREMAELAAAIDAVLQSAGLSSADVAVLVEDVEAILEAAGVGHAEIQAVVHDLQAIAGSIQAPSGGSKTQPSDASKRRRGRGRS